LQRHTALGFVVIVVVVVCLMFIEHRLYNLCYISYINPLLKKLNLENEHVQQQGSISKVFSCYFDLFYFYLLAKCFEEAVSFNRTS